VSHAQPLPHARPLRLLTYLAPGLPLALFELVARHLARVLGVGTRVASDETRSAPGPLGPDPFAADEADVGFLCAPGYLWLAAKAPPSVELVEAALVFDDPRNGGRPAYFADVIVAERSAARSLADLAGARWVYNDPCSLSGYFSVLARLTALGLDARHFATARAIGSHHAALAAVEAGAADVAAIDSNTLRAVRRSGGARGVRVLESLGPYPVQPIVVRAGLDAAVKRVLAPALLAMHKSPGMRAGLEAHGVRRFAPVSDADYASERALLGATADERETRSCPAGTTASA